MKTTRNNWENSGFHNKTRNLMFNGQPIRWPQLISLVEDGGRFSLANKMTYDHLHLTPSLRMKVKLATQVLSTSVADAFRIVGGHDTTSVEKFVRMMDQFFDCLNVSNRCTGARKRKPVLEPYTSPDDWRFKWLEEDFPHGFIDQWEAEAQAVPNLSKDQRNQLCLSRETLEGIRITVKSFVALARDLLMLPGVTFFLSEKLSQDPLEEYFSQQRGIGGRCDNPNVQQFSNNALKIQVARSPAVLASTRVCRSMQKQMPCIGE
ncbi:uncharacterized protein LOC135482905 [Lineus longissimus]|uniref:uncharacterized protein LOC135482905 n=1 Tax=Lineus longissimus TaxID=88925 RepID=UPI00315D3B6B